MKARTGRMAAVLAAASLAASPATLAAAESPPPQASVTFDPGLGDQGGIPRAFVGFSIEWSLIERYMGPGARPAFANLLHNLGTGVLRIGGSSQDVMPFQPDGPDGNRVITPADLSAIRSTLDAVNGPGRAPAWGVVLGTAMSPPSASRPFVSPDHARTFVRQGVAPAFDGAERDVAGIELGNEPDLSYKSDLDAYLRDLEAYSDPDVTGPFPVIVPNTSEDILPWQDIDGRTVPTRYFWDWPRILDTAAARTRSRAGAFGAYASDHFYPLARTCPNKPYRCPSIGALLSDEHMASLDYQVYAHASEARRHGLGYRLEETNTAAGRGADGVSNVAAAATYGLDLMFHAACPQPPADPASNASCATGAVGVNFHNAEVRAFFAPEEGNGYYNAIDYDVTPAMGAPTAAPLYYAALVFARFAQGGTGVRPVPVTTGDAGAVKAWGVDGDDGERRLFLINKGDHPVTLTVSAPGSTALVDRMTPYDASGAGRTLDAPGVRVDGREVAADGTWPGFHPTAERIEGHRMPVTVAAGEACVVTLHDHQ